MAQEITQPEQISKTDIKSQSYPQYPQAELAKPLVKPRSYWGIPDLLAKILPEKLRQNIPSRIGLITGESTIKSHTSEKIQRPLSLREVRARLAKELRHTPEEGERKQLIQEGHAWDEVAYQFLKNQKDFSVQLGELGKQSAQYVVLTPPKEIPLTQEQEQQPPVFIVLGISQDLEGAGILPQELALQGRKVVVISYPDGWKGTVTPEFGMAAENSHDFEPYTNFFKQAIIQIAKQPEVQEKLGDFFSLDILGHSTGATIIAELLHKDVDMQSMVRYAILANPAACVDQSALVIPGTHIEIPLPIALFNESIRMITNIRNFLHLNISNRENIRYTQEHRENQLRAYNALRKKVLMSSKWWEQEMHTKDDGEIVVLSTTHDLISKSQKVTEKISQNSALHSLIIPGIHDTVLIDPNKALAAINQKLEGKFILPHSEVEQ